MTGAEEAYELRKKIKAVIEERWLCVDDLRNALKDVLLSVDSESSDAVQQAVWAVDEDEILKYYELIKRLRENK